MSSIHYEYTPLASESSFRLFRLIRQPLTSSEPPGSITIELFEASFDHPPEFEAVSYAWNGESLERTIVCNGQHMRVTPSVLDFLHAVRDMESIGTFWIDSICINQSSVQEKNFQVPRMRDIYRGAVMVWVWLGRGTYETDTAFNYLSEVATALAEGNGNSAQLHENYKDEIRKSRGVYDAADTDFIVDIINLPWFHRTWTVQELTLARHAEVLCGSKHLCWADFLDILLDLQILESKFLGFSYVQENSSPETEQEGSNPATFHDDLSCYADLGRLTQFTNQDQISSQDGPILTALRHVRRKGVSDPRDKVYGLYGIFEHAHISGLPSVDYERTVQDLYKAVAMAVIERDGSLSILSQACLQPLVPDLPSWVPDWSNTAFYHPIISNNRNDSMHLYTIDNGRFMVPAIFMDRVCTTAHSTSICTPDFRRGWRAKTDLFNATQLRDAVTELIRTMRAWIMLYDSIHGFQDLSNWHGTITLQCLGDFRETIAQNGTPDVSPKLLTWEEYIDREEPFWSWIRIITADSCELQALHLDIQAKRGYESMVEEYRRLFRFSSDPQEWPEEIRKRLICRLHSFEVSRLQHDIGRNSYQRTFFTTDNSSIGIGPRWAQPKDSIVLIGGESIPYIVREVKGNYTLVGPAYVHGMMERNKWDDVKSQMITLV